MKWTKEGIAVLEHDDRISQWVESAGRLDYDPTVASMILPHIPKGSVVCDIGANIGSHATAYARHVGPEGWVMAFEPHLNSLECLEWNMARHNNVSIYPFALGGYAAHLPFHRNEDRNPGDSYITHNPDEYTFLCKVETLDRVIDATVSINAVQFIKLDVQGFEPCVLAGARRQLSRFHPAIWVEIHPPSLARYGFTPDDVFDTLRLYGYNSFQRMTGNDELSDWLCMERSL